ncbi:ubiquinol:oxygen oxidoreductase [Aureococcus anophagefferens]|uniref:Ubiquinol:oxygen oxidoreductase n=2 Tax=Aureococcus anophagefferens TaxID=44056 RepID=A0ABR1G5X1_AURAN
MRSSTSRAAALLVVASCGALAPPVRPGAPAGALWARVPGASAAEYAAVYGPRDCASPAGDGMDERIFALNEGLVGATKGAIDALYEGRDFARFYVLETLARVPYFAYLSVMHLRETFGDRRPGDSERMRTHYAEADNELHHLLIMESLGGNSSAVDRTLAQSMAFFYFWYVTVVYSFSEPAAYHLSELIEDHAFNTYDDFIKDHGPKLKGMPVPDIARKYYERDDPYLRDQFLTVKETDGGFTSRSRPPLESLYDVFVNIRDDEKEHWKTLCNLVQFDDLGGDAAGAPEPTRPCVVVGDECFIEGEDECAAEPVLVASR